SQDDLAKLEEKLGKSAYGQYLTKLSPDWRAIGDDDASQTGSWMRRRAPDDVPRQHASRGLTLETVTGFDSSAREFRQPGGVT
ncbi:hypothetical protein ACCT20_37760, partial [Rhizobium ruizarguesonis]